MLRELFDTEQKREIVPKEVRDTDRRQQKTRAAIFSAFVRLLEKQNYSRITIQDIIDEANVGRTTFYSHFETKDMLLEEFCSDLFSHVFSSEGDSGLDTAMEHICRFDSEHDGVCGIHDNSLENEIAHILFHLTEHKNDILKILKCEDSDLLLRYFRDALSKSFTEEVISLLSNRKDNVPPAFLANYISGSFIDMIRWWVENGMKETPKQMSHYYLCLITPVIGQNK